MLAVSFRQRTAASGLDHALQLSRDGSAWTPGDADPAFVAVSTVPDGSGFVIETHVFDPGGLGRPGCLFRVRQSILASREKRADVVGPR